MRKILVTTALPYANGPLHLGHILEGIQADIWVRWQKLSGNNCIFISGADAHGTPIMLNAEEQGITPDALVAKIKTDHEKDFADFHIDFDNYFTTHSKENETLTAEIYQKLKTNNDIICQDVEQAFDTKRNMFLPDRFIKGTCPSCGAPDQYGDSCENCGSTYNATDLVNPISKLSGETPILKTSEHFFFRLDKYTQFLHEFMREKGRVQPVIQHKLYEWFHAGLKTWDISRDEPYFGFQIPGTTNKYFYVWLDAPIGYLAAFKNLCQKRPELNFNKYWQENSETELYHFIGKDIVYFHTLFWPAILKSAEIRRPNAVFVHGFVTVNGQKMSKSRGTFITARNYLNSNTLTAEHLRYYFAAKLNNGIDDLDLNFTELAHRINSDLVGKIVNIASRSAAFISKYFENNLAENLANQALFDEFIAVGSKISHSYEQRKFSDVIREITTLADNANKYIDEEKPWVQAKDQVKLAQVQSIATMGLNLFRVLMIYLKPILPNMAKETEYFLNTEPFSWLDLDQPLLGQQIREFKPLLQRIDLKNLNI